MYPIYGKYITSWYHKCEYMRPSCYHKCEYMRPLIKKNYAIRMQNMNKLHYYNLLYLLA